MVPNSETLFFFSISEYVKESSPVKSLEPFLLDNVILIIRRSLFTCMYVCVYTEENKCIILIKSVAPKCIFIMDFNFY